MSVEQGIMSYMPRKMGRDASWGVMITALPPPILYLTQSVGINEAQRQRANATTIPTISADLEQLPAQSRAGAGIGPAVDVSRGRRDERGRHVKESHGCPVLATE